jgi:hypothetical protein
VGAPGLARHLLTAAVDELDMAARAECSLAGCNAIFLETNSSLKVTPEQACTKHTPKYIRAQTHGIRARALPSHQKYAPHICTCVHTLYTQTTQCMRLSLTVAGVGVRV